MSMLAFYIRGKIIDYSTNGTISTRKKISWKSRSDALLLTPK